MRQKRQNNHKTFWQWLGRQNVFVLLAICFAVFYLGRRVYANVYTSQSITDKNKADLQIERVQPSPSPIATPTPSPVPFPTQKPKATTIPFPSFKPVPTPKPLEIIQHVEQPTFDAPELDIQQNNQNSTELSAEAIQIKKDLLQLEMDQCKADAISEKNTTYQTCFVSPPGSWQDNCIAKADEKYENALLICLYTYEYEMSKL